MASQNKATLSPSLYGMPVMPCTTFPIKSRITTSFGGTVRKKEKKQMKSDRLRSRDRIRRENLETGKEFQRIGTNCHC